MRQENIVQFHRSFTFANCTYLVLELCPNGSLMDMVKRRKGLTEPEVRFYSVQIAGAIKYMHARGIIHRDLKMGNIFLDKDMNTKVGDFGLAALVVTGKDMQTIRRTTLCGTPNYIAPEILQKGKVGHDHMVDIWSLGIIMYVAISRGLILEAVLTITGLRCSPQSHHSSRQQRMRSTAEQENEITTGQRWNRSTSAKKLGTLWLPC